MILIDNTSFNLLWSGALIALAVLFLGVYSSVGQGKNRFSIIKFVEEHLMKTVIVIMVAGLLLYGVAFWEGRNAGNLIVMIPKTIVSALGMFVSSSDIVELKSEMKHNVLFMTLFTLVHFSAVLISIMVILKVLGYKFRSFLKMHFQKPADRTLVFFGINDNSLMLAESIHEKEKENVSIVFVELPSVDKYEYNPLVGLFNKNSIQRSSICRMEEMGAYMIKAQHVFQDINQNEACTSSAGNIYMALGLDTLNCFIRHTKAVQFYFLSDSEQENMDNLMDIIKFYGTADFDRIPVEKIYCHARRNSLNSIIGRTSQKIQFADSSNLSVLQLLKKVAYQPAAFVEIDTERAVVTSDFNALVVGFGETGRDAFNFLYEFSSFLGPDGELAPRTIHVADAKLSERKTKFLNNNPALKDKGDINWWADMSIDSREFWDKYMEMVDRLNYIVITLGDDKMASDLAVKMYQMAYRYRGNLNRFKIFVRLKDSDSAQLLNHVSEYYTKKSNRDDKGSETLVPFGTYRTLFNAEIFDTEIVDKDASEFSDQYYEIYQQINEKLDEETAPAPTCLAKDVKNQTNSQQDVSNVRHISTKLLLAGVIVFDSNNQPLCDVDRMEKLRLISERVGLEYLNAPVGSPEFTLMENLSLCEHLRWNAKMELMGFVPGEMNPKVKYPERSYDFKTHECLVSCHELNTVPKFQSVKIYDWAVVELSMKYYDDKKNKRYV